MDSADSFVQSVCCDLQLANPVKRLGLAQWFVQEDGSSVRALQNLTGRLPVIRSQIRSGFDRIRVGAWIENFHLHPGGRNLGANLAGATNPSG